MIDDGIPIAIPEESRWNPDKVKGSNNEQFIRSLNTASIQLLNQSLDRIMKPSSSIKTWN